MIAGIVYIQRNRECKAELAVPDRISRRVQYSVPVTEFKRFISCIQIVKTGNYKFPIFGSYVIVSPSMIPTIKVNDAIIVKRDNNDKYIVGDIISFYSTEYDSRGMVITHRIINKDKKSNNTSLYTTKGDNNSIADKNSVNTDNVYGKVLFILPKIGFIKNFLSKPINIILCILIPSSFIIVVDLGHISILFKKNTKVV